MFVETFDAVRTESQPKNVSASSRAASPLASVALDGWRIDRALGSGIEVVEASCANRNFPVRINESLGICLKAGPAHVVRVDGRETVYPVDAICVRPPGCIWSTASTGLAAFLSVDVHRALLPKGLKLGGGMRFARSGSIPQPRALTRALRAGVSPDRLAELVTDLLLALDEVRLVQAEELRETARSSAVQRVRDTLESAVADVPSLEALAHGEGISRFALLRQFKKVFGVTPHAFTLSLRVERARHRLARGADLSTVAVELGFADQPHFTRVFRKMVGMPPGVYARRVRRTFAVANPAISFKTPFERLVS